MHGAALWVTEMSPSFKFSSRYLPRGGHAIIVADSDVSMRTIRSYVTLASKGLVSESLFSTTQTSSQVAYSNRGRDQIQSTPSPCQCTLD